MAPVRLILPLLLVLILVVPGRYLFEPGPAGMDGTSGAIGSPTILASPETGLDAPVRPPPFPASLDALFQYVTELARDRAAGPWVPPLRALPPALASMGYDEYSSIEFQEEAALWRAESPFEVHFFPPGYLYASPVRIHEVRDEEVRAIDLPEGAFRVSGPAAALEGLLTPDLGFAGFRVHFPLNVPDSWDEIAVFLGASYFRLLGPGHAHGLSSRGLAVDTTSPDGEEFPDFREFWLVRPDPEAGRMDFFALLDGPSVTGAYHFVLMPDAATVVEVDARLFARADVDRLGVAPLTSMFLFGPDEARAFDDLRPRVHDSEGLLMLTHFQEWIWRPLANRATLQVTQLRDRDPLGFGLAQRSRDFADYLDLEARYHQRPSQWVEVLDGDWGDGGVELVEIPTDSEFHDNIVAYWASDEPFRAGESRRYQYRLRTFDTRLEQQSLAQVERTRVGWAALPGQGDPPPREHRRFVVDFHHFAPESQSPGLDAEKFPSTDGSAPEVEAILEVSRGRTSDLRVQALPEDAGWRATFRLEPEGSAPADMRLFLLREDGRVSETWSYLWTPDDRR